MKPNLFIYKFFKLNNKIFKFYCILTIYSFQTHYIVAARIIFPNQYEFVQGRQIQDCIGIASETINMLSKKVRGGNVA